MSAEPQTPPPVTEVTDDEMRKREARGALGSRLGDRLARTLGWLPGMLIDPSVFERWRWLRRNAARGVRTLDAGCGSGWFSIYLARLGNDVTGVELLEQARATAERRAVALGVGHARFAQGDLRELDRMAPDLGSFEQIICFEAIEHIIDDAKLIRDLAGLLEPGGRLLLTTPSDDHHRLLGETISETEDGGHVRFGYSHARLRELCDGAGLRVTRESRFCGPIGQKAYDLARRMTPSVGFAAALLITGLLRPLQLLDPLLTRLLRYPELHVAIVAQKPGGVAP